MQYCLLCAHQIVFDTMYLRHELADQYGKVGEHNGRKDDTLAVTSSCSAASSYRVHYLQSKYMAGAAVCASLQRSCWSEFVKFAHRRRCCIWLF